MIAASASTTPLLLRGAAVVVAHATALLRYPRPLHRTESFEHATTFVGAWGGFPVFHGIGLSRASPLAVTTASDDSFATAGEVDATSATAAAAAAASLGGVLFPVAAASAMSPLARRLIHVAVGSCLVLLTRVVAKAALTPVVLGLLRLLPGWVRRSLQPPLAHKALGMATTTTTITENEDGAGGAASEGVQRRKGQKGGGHRGEPGSGSNGSRRPADGGSRGSVCTTEPQGTSKAGLGQRRRVQKGACSGTGGGSTEGVTEGPGPRTAEVLVGDSHHADHELDDLAGAARSGAGAGQFAVSGPDAGLALRPDGYPADADAVRRYLCYCLVVVAVVAYHEAATLLGFV